MRILLPSLVAGLLTGCSTAPRDVAIDGLDLADGKTLAALQKALPLDDRGALGTYALLHWPKSKFYCGTPIGGRMAAASTVGEAIDLTRAYEAKLLRVQGSESRIKAPEESTDKRDIIDRIERLVLERDMLFQRLGPAARSSAEARALDQRLVILKKKLSTIGDNGEVQAGQARMLGPKT